MAAKEYFIKASWIDEDQPLLRTHRTTKMFLDLTEDHWKLVENVEKECMGKLYIVKNFCIDFMIVAE